MHLFEAGRLRVITPGGRGDTSHISGQIQAKRKRFPVKRPQGFKSHSSTNTVSIRPAAISCIDNKARRHAVFTRSPAAGSGEAEKASAQKDWHANGAKNHKKSHSF
jgi:hypothetical protein